LVYYAAMRKVVLTTAALTVIALSACGGETPAPQAPPPPSAVPATPPAPATPAATTPGAAAVAPAETKPAEKPPEAAVVVIAMKFVPAKGSKHKAMELKDDGSISEGDKAIGKIANDALQDAAGNTIATIGKDGSVTVTGSEKPLKFSDAGELERDDGMKISVADDGTLTVVAKAKAKPDTNVGKFEAFNPKARRAAGLMLAFDELKKEAQKAAKAKEATKPAAPKADKAAPPKAAPAKAADKAAPATAAAKK
jgi:hypothetical protein